MKFLHAADLHLDSPFLGLSRYPGAPEQEVRGATRRALENLVALAIAESVAFVLIAGDIYDGDWKDYNTGLFFAQQMSRLGEAGIAVYMIRGNHDAKSQITRSLRLPVNVHEFPASKPATMLLPDLQVAIHGQSFATQAVVDDLASSYPDAVPGFFNIGLLHTSATGREGHESYAPCSVAGLLSKNYDYWALGHIHQREVLHESPHIVFSGNTQGRHIHESGSKGCTLVEVDAGEVASVEHRRLDAMQWLTCDIDVAGAGDMDQAVNWILGEVQQRIAALDADCLVAIRVVLSGACEAHGALASDPERFASEIRAVLTDSCGGRLWLEKLVVKTSPSIDLDKVAGHDDAIGQLVLFVREAAKNPALMNDLLGEFQDLKGRLPSVLSSGEDGIDLESAEAIARRLPDVERDLAAYLLGGEAAQ